MRGGAQKSESRDLGDGRDRNQTPNACRARSSVPLFGGFLNPVRWLLVSVIGSPHTRPPAHYGHKCTVRSGAPFAAAPSKSLQSTSKSQSGPHARSLFTSSVFPLTRTVYPRRPSSRHTGAQARYCGYMYSLVRLEHNEGGHFSSGGRPSACGRRNPRFPSPCSRARKPFYQCSRPTKRSAQRSSSRGSGK
jgi:hypothetical protein